MEAQPENTPKPVIDVKEPDKLMMPKDFKNLPINNRLGIPAETLMTVLKNKNNWDESDPYNLTSPEVCASICHTWSNEYLMFNNQL